MIFADGGHHGVSIILDVVSINHYRLPCRCCVLSHAQQDGDIDREVLQVERGEHEDCIEPGVCYTTFIPISHKCFVIKDVTKDDFRYQGKDKGARDNDQLFLLLLVVVRDSLLQSDDQHGQSKYVGDQDNTKESSDGGLKQISPPITPDGLILIIACN